MQQSDFDPVRELLSGTVPAFALAAVCLLVAWRPWRRQRAESGKSNAWGAPLALGLGYALGHVLLEGWPEASWFPDIRHQILYSGLAAMLLALCATRSGRGARIVRVLLCAAVPAYLLSFQLRNGRWTAQELATWTGALALAGFLVWELEERLARRRRGLERPLVWIAVTALAAASLFQGGSVSQTNLAVVLLVCLAACAALGLREPAFTLGSAAGVAVIVLGGLLLAGRTVSYLPDTSAALLFAAPLASWLAELPPLGSARPRLRGALAVVLAVIPGAYALWLAVP